MAIQILFKCLVTKLIATTVDNRVNTVSNIGFFSCKKSLQYNITHQSFLAHFNEIGSTLTYIKRIVNGSTH